MGFESFRVNVVVRAALLVALITVFAWSLVETGWQATPIVCAVLIVLALGELVYYVESVNRELASFLDFVSHHDFSASFPIAEKGRVFRELERAYKVLSEEFRKLNLEKALNHQYLESVVEHVSTALICLDDEGRVTLMNRRAKELLRVPQLSNLGSFKRVGPELPGLLERLGDDDRTLVTLDIDGEAMQLALFATQFELLERRHKLISFQNIRDELEQREVDFSQKLIRVLTHEIMNSVTPIISLSKVVEEALEKIGDGAAGALDAQEREDLVRSVASIQSRGTGLLRFVKAYSELTNLPQPRLADVRVDALLRQVETLMASTLDANRVAVETEVAEPGLTVRADPEQLQQVLINLVKNAVEALDGRDEARVRLRAERDHQGKVLLHVIDNGEGIDPEQLDNIFVPFFTTKRDGTGVGLSVSRQIMFRNRGLISVRSSPGLGCEFTLRFK